MLHSVKQDLQPVWNAHQLVNFTSPVSNKGISVIHYMSFSQTSNLTFTLTSHYDLPAVKR